MKILQVFPLFHPAKGFGPIKIIYNISKELIEKGHNVIVATTNLINPLQKMKDFKNFEREEGIYIHRFPIIQLKRYFISISFIRFILANKFDIIHVHGTQHFLCDIILLFKRLKIIKCPVVLNPDGGIGSDVIAKDSYSIQKRLIYKIYGIFLQILINSSERILALCKYEKKFLLDFGIKKNKLKIVLCGINLKEYSIKIENNNIRERFNIKESFIILHVGRLAKVKGIQILMKALYKVLLYKEDIVLLLVGPDDGYKKSLIQLVTELNLENKVKFCGVLSNDDLLKMYDICDIVVIPSEIEMFGLVSVEAGAFEKPVIATNVGPLPMIIKDEYSGIIVPYGNYEILSNKIITLMENPDFRKELGKNGRKRVIENFTWSIAGDKIESIYKNIHK